MNSRALSEISRGLGGDLDAALDRLLLPAHFVDRNGTIRWQNEKSIGLVGDVRGRHFVHMLAPVAHHAARVEFAKKVIGSARGSRFCSVMRRVSGENVPVRVHSVVVEGDGDIVGVFSIVDATVGRPAQPPEGLLTPRQYEVLRWLAQGLSTEQIAETSNVSRETVRNHVRGLLRTLRVHSRVAAIAEARRRGILD